MVPNCLPIVVFVGCLFVNKTKDFDSLATSRPILPYLGTVAGLEIYKLDQR